VERNLPSFGAFTQKSERPVGGPAARALGMEGTVVETGWAGPDHICDSAVATLRGR
jgi:hypothetical protein